MFLVLWVLALCCSLCALGSANSTGQHNGAPHQARRGHPSLTTVLFIGNSLTSKNKLPLQFEWIAKSARKRVKVYASLLPSATLQDHLNSPQTMKMLRARPYSFVIMQEQSAFLSFGLEFARRYSWPGAIGLQNAAGTAQIVLYETMAYARGGGYANDTYDLMQERVIDGYESLRERLGCQTAHVGKTWQHARHVLDSRNISSEALLYLDDRHPTPRGTFLAACAIFAQVFKLNPTSLRPTLDRHVPRSFAHLSQVWVEDVSAF